MEALIKRTVHVDKLGGFFQFSLLITAFVRMRSLSLLAPTAMYVDTTTPFRRKVPPRFLGTSLWG